MVPKQRQEKEKQEASFRAVLFRMVPKHELFEYSPLGCFRAVLFRMVPKLVGVI